MSFAIDKQLLQQWIADRMEPHVIEQILSSQGHDADTVSAYLKAYKKARNEKKQFIGFCITALGAVLGFISCLLSILNPIPELYNFILFGVTSVAILLIIAGMYLVFE